MFLNKSNFDIESASTKPLLDNQSSRHWVVSAAILGRLAKRPRLPPRPAQRDSELNPSLLPSLTLEDAILLQLEQYYNEYSLAYAVVPNTEEQFSQPFLGLSKI